MITKSLNPELCRKLQIKTNNHSLFMDEIVFKTCLIITQERKGLSDKICNYSMFVDMIIWWM